LRNVLRAIPVESADVNDYRPLDSRAELARPQLPNRLFSFGHSIHRSAKHEYLEALVAT